MGTLASGSIDLKSLKVASGEATSYITKIDGGGIKVHDAGDMNNYIQLTSDGMSIYKNSEEPIAQYREFVQVGKPSSSYLFIDNNGLSLKDKGLPIFQIRNESLDPSIDIEVVRWGPQDSNGWNSTENQRYEAKTIEINFDISTMTEGQEFNLSFTWSGNIYTNNTDHRYTNQLYEYTFEYGTAETTTYKKTITYPETVFTVTYDGINLITIRSATNPVSPTTTDFVRVSKYYNIKVSTVDNISTIPTTIIGPEVLSHTIMDYHSLQLIDKEGKTYFHISDLRDINGYCAITDYFTGDGDRLYFPFSSTPASSVSVEVDNVQQIYGIDYTYSNISGITFITAPSDGLSVVIDYKSTDSALKAFTFGTRDSRYHIGQYSVVEGYNCIASGTYSHASGRWTEATAICAHAEGAVAAASGKFSHAEGDNTTASGEGSHAEGVNTTASGAASHAEGGTTSASGSASHAEGQGSIARGNYSHAEGYQTETRGDYTHAEGYDTETTMDYAHAQNKGTIASAECQTAIGSYNATDSDALFIMGNGTADNARSNALTVDWYGNIMSQGMAGQVIMYAGSTAPIGWLLCNGSAVSRTTYATLFAVIGTTYGAGDGSTTFNLPNFQGRVPVGVGESTATGHTNHTLGQTDGNEDAIVPHHNHSVSAVTNAITGGSHTHDMRRTQLATATTGSNRYFASGSIESGFTTSSETHTHNLPAHNTNYEGTSGNTVGANMMPYIGINYIIATGKTY